MKLKLIAQIVTANNEPQPLSTGPESPINTLVNNLTPEQKELKRHRDGTESAYSQDPSGNTVEMMKIEKQ